MHTNLTHLMGGSQYHLYICYSGNISWYKSQLISHTVMISSYLWLTALCAVVIWPRHSDFLQRLCTPGLTESLWVLNKKLKTHRLPPTTCRVILPTTSEVLRNPELVIVLILNLYTFLLTRKVIGQQQSFFKLSPTNPSEQRWRPHCTEQAISGGTKRLFQAPSLHARSSGSRDKYPRVFISHVPSTLPASRNHGDCSSRHKVSAGRGDKTSSGSSLPIYPDDLWLCTNGQFSSVLTLYPT